jgi:hypothetical protein
VPPGGGRAPTLACPGATRPTIGPDPEPGNLRVLLRRDVDKPLSIGKVEDAVPVVHRAVPARLRTAVHHDVRALVSDDQVHGKHLGADAQLPISDLQSECRVDAAVVNAGVAGLHLCVQPLQRRQHHRQDIGRRTGQRLSKQLLIPALLGETATQGRAGRADCGRPVGSWFPLAGLRHDHDRTRAHRQPTVNPG